MITEQGKAMSAVVKSWEGVTEKAEVKECLRLTAHSPIMCLTAFKSTETLSHYKSNPLPSSVDCAGISEAFPTGASPSSANTTICWRNQGRRKNWALKD
ncbi:uncharacterized [Tachysurus ichikawai]